MVRIQIVFSLILCFALSNLMAQSNDDPSAYMSEISAPFEESKNETWAYLKAVTRGKGAKKVDAKRQELLLKIKAAKQSSMRKKAFQGDNSLKEAVVAYFDLSYKVLNEDFEKIMDMEEVAEQSYDQMEAYLLAKQIAGDKLEKGSEDFNNVYKTFAENNNVNLIDGEQDRKSEKIAKASKALSYYNDFFLVFFKSNIQEVYALDALNKSDVNGVQQNVNALISFSKEGISKVNGMKSFDGDNSLKLATKEILNFYKEEGEKDFKVAIDFYIKKANFEKVKQSFESKSKKDRTQQDIDQYNKAADEYNAGINDFNNAVQAMNKNRTKALNAWNKSVEQFFNKHS